MHPNRTSILLVEADHDARHRHEAALRGAGFCVIPLPAWTDTTTARSAAIIVVDFPTFRVLQRDAQARRLPAVVVIAGDIKSGIGACLRGAEDWLPVNGDNAYVVETVKRALHS